jgi:hypothetical protein
MRRLKQSTRPSVQPLRKSDQLRPLPAATKHASTTIDAHKDSDGLDTNKIVFVNFFRRNGTTLIVSKYWNGRKARQAKRQKTGCQEQESSCLASTAVRQLSTDRSKLNTCQRGSIGSWPRASVSVQAGNNVFMQGVTVDLSLV